MDWRQVDLHLVRELGFRLEEIEQMTLPEIAVYLEAAAARPRPSQTEREFLQAFGGWQSMTPRQKLLRR